MRKLMTAVVAAVAMALVGGAAQAANETLSRQTVAQSTWLIKKIEPSGAESRFLMTFNADGTFLFLTKVNGQFQKDSGTYEVGGGYITLKTSKDTLRLKVLSYGGNRMQIEFDGARTNWERLNN